MTWTVYGAFVLASLVLAIAPGPDNLFVLVQSSLYGAKAGILIVFGLVAGLVLQTLAAACGIAAVVAASEWLFWAIRLAGAAYLAYLAVMAWKYPTSSVGQGAGRLSNAALVRRGLIMNVTNPKVQIFFLAFFPQFVTPGATSAQTAVEMIVLGATFMAATLLVFGAIAFFAGSLADKLRTPTVQFWLNRSASVIFAALAVFTLSGV